MDGATDVTAPIQHTPGWLDPSELRVGMRVKPVFCDYPDDDVISLSLDDPFAKSTIDFSLSVSPAMAYCAA